MTVLDRIKDAKKARLSELKCRVSLSELKSMIVDSPPCRDFQSAIKRPEDSPLRLIAEIKRCSPSKGLISKDFDHLVIASIYEELPVSAISVLTEEDFFGGSAQILKDVKDKVSKPILRKDFIFDEYQIYESRAIGADAILLIASLLDRSQSSEFLHLAQNLAMSVLYEVHDEQELQQAIAIDAPIIGVNNRNLKTLSIDISLSERLIRMMPPCVVKVSESGIENRSDVLKIERAGFDAALIGTSIMLANDKAAKIRELWGIEQDETR